MMSIPFEVVTIAVDLCQSQPLHTVFVIIKWLSAHGLLLRASQYIHTYRHGRSMCKLLFAFQNTNKNAPVSTGTPSKSVGKNVNPAGTRLSIHCLILFLSTRSFFFLSRSQACGWCEKIIADGRYNAPIWRFFKSRSPFIREPKAVIHWSTCNDTMLREKSF